MSCIATCVILFIVELYKCEVLSTTCGECLNPSNSRYKCGWCQSLSSNCDVRELCPDTATFLTSDHNSCPFLEITNVCVPLDSNYRACVCVIGWWFWSARYHLVKLEAACLYKSQKEDFCWRVSYMSLVDITSSHGQFISVDRAYRWSSFGSD